jgi:purine-nucleoside phosphorylase
MIVSEGGGAAGGPHPEAIAAAVGQRLGARRPRALLTLGSGLGGLADEVADGVAMEAAEVGLPDAGVAGHHGRLVAGTLAGVEVLVQQGRVHRYEGWSPAAVAATVNAAAALGCDTFLVTNAAGGLGDAQRPGDLMVITDQLNLTGDTPLQGPHFVDMAGAYAPTLAELAHDTAEAEGVRLKAGVYAGVRGPAYETPAEAAMLRTLGADAVGMSTVLEVVAARAAGMAVWGCSLITNVHRPGGTPLDHGQVLAAADDAGPRLARVVRGVTAGLA